ncbi:MAG TPA: class I SAM-dependent methyltransferase [Patescibacteria group bacterium]|nr:class I SAM-dependent methyltransferase [Patescibacteria group bacterium]
MTTETGSGPTRDAGSFRDPSGYVFQQDGRVFRAVDAPCAAILRGLSGKGALARLVADGLVVPTEILPPSPLTERLVREHPGYDQFLEHERIQPVTYPYCWTVSMLADAGLHTLDLQIRLLESGHSLKDATAYNIQFVNGRPLFIDLSSIEKPARLDIWVALGQFQQMFTFPLLLVRYRGWDLRSYFLGSLGGRTVEQVARAFPGPSRLRPRLLLDLTLPLWLNRRGDTGKTGGREILTRPNPDSGAQVLNLRRLRRKIARLADGYRPHGTWSRYTGECSYTDAAEDAKKALVRSLLEPLRPATVLDLGCNTGDYSYLAAGLGAAVVAADGDHDAVELLYRRLRKTPARITPMVIDIGNPSPAIGFRNLERASFHDRVRADCVLALAVIHHLHVSGNLPLELIGALFADLTRDALILEFVPPDDPQFQRLTRFRLDSYAGMTIENCLAAFASRFELVRREPVPGSPRTLLLLRRRGGPTT